MANVLTIAFEGLERAIARVRDARKRARRMETPLQRLRPIVKEEIDANFTQEGRNLRGPGTPWKPLAPSTILTRVQLGFGPRPILTRTGKLRRQLVVRVVGDTLQVISRRPQAAAMHFGYPPRRIPARPWMRFSKRATDRVRKGLLEVLR